MPNGIHVLKIGELTGEMTECDGFRDNGEDCPNLVRVRHDPYFTAQLALCSECNNGGGEIYGPLDEPYSYWEEEQQEQHTFTEQCCADCKQRIADEIADEERWTEEQRCIDEHRFPNRGGLLVAPSLLAYVRAQKAERASQVTPHRVRQSPGLTVTLACSTIYRGLYTSPHGGDTQDMGVSSCSMMSDMGVPGAHPRDGPAAVRGATLERPTRRPNQSVRMLARRLHTQRSRVHPALTRLLQLGPAEL